MPADPAIPPLQEAKRALRRSAKAARASAAAADRQAGGTGAAVLRDHFLAAVPLAEGVVVSAYWPMGDEIDPRPLMDALAGRGHRLALPAIRAAGQPLDFRAWRPGDALQPAGFGTREPLSGAEELRPGLLLVPLLAFDGAGYRLGYGGGFYDRSLALLRKAGDTLAVGLAYAGQQVAAVPREVTDQPLDLVVTERGVVTPGAPED
ncbi:5-formyltetrahydrofolate cyclo-ligase [Pelagibius marinus]|uniref:5-formyltetrahydrofolate cyclo-ligase n=1 Tax=Pelagibius marinus TaxID=2762760 RepID=UPI001D054DE4|nr:5-formyltetrahydrofolate cyclo-ligase [Pelagibius marinus]